MTRFGVVALAAALFVMAPIAGAAEPAELPAGAVGGAIVVTATVEAIDLETRQVTLKGRDGTLRTLTVSEDARNLPQLKVGDVVSFTYFEALALALDPVETAVRSRRERDELARTPAGAKPGGVVTRTIEVTGTVQNIDREKRVVTLRGPKRTVTLKVEDDVDLANIKEGQTVLARYVEGFAIEVTTP